MKKNKTNNKSKKNNKNSKKKKNDLKFFDSSKNKYILIISLVLFFIISLTTISIVYIPIIEIEETEHKINYNSYKKIPKYKAYNLIKDYTNEVKIKNNIDYSKIGTYQVEYKLKYGIANITKKVEVSIVDTIPPEILLKGENKVTICPGKEYIDPGYSAKDEYDGDITNKVIINKEKEKISYSVIDLSGNYNVVVREISYKDEEKPKINLKGNNTIYINTGSKFNDPGYTATDNCDGDLTKNVKVLGGVDTSKKGKYILNYEVTDTEGNKTTASRTIWVYQKNYVSSSGGNAGTIYLTFDDGPNNYITNGILDILKDENVLATFFVTTSGSDNIIKREYQEGHTVALHTSSHNYKYIYSSIENYFNDLNIVSNRVKRITGIESKIIRFPGGSSNTISGGTGIMKALTSEVLNRGYSYYDWNVDSGDAGRCANSNDKSNCVYQNVVNNLSKSKANYVLMHDIKSYTKDALRDIIAYGKVNGYKFEPITEKTPMYTHYVNN